MRLRIAAAAARLMAEDGIDDYALAKRKAAKQLGADDTRSLPGNEEVEAELRAYQSLYQNDEQRARIRMLRKSALDAMRLLAEFRPYLAGAVLKGTAGRYGEIDLQLFTDDSKAVGIALLNRNIPYDVSDERRFASGRERAVSVLKLVWDGTPLNLSIYATNDERATLKNSAGGRAIDRADIDAVAELVTDGP
jgi:hypothetical protein